MRAATRAGTLRGWLLLVIDPLCREQWIVLFDVRRRPHRLWRSFPTPSLRIDEINRYYRQRWQIWKDVMAYRLITDVVIRYWRGGVV
jgi:hypothetical protein